MIRRFEPSDENDLIRVWLASTIPGQDFLTEEFWRSQESPIRQELLPIAEIWVVEEDGELVAFISLFKELIGGLFTHPDHQGKGHGRALIEHAHSLHDPLRIEVFRKNERAISLYEKCGFVEESSRVHEATGLEAVIMRMDGAPSHVLGYPGHELLLGNIVRAENCRLYDSRGNEYVDLESGVWCTSIGHGHPRILTTIAEQSARIGHAGFNYSSGIVEQAACEILALLGFEGGGCVFLCSGSEAVEYGVRVAQSVSDRPLLMTMTDSYFGAYGSASRRQEDEWYCFDWTACRRLRPESDGCHEGCEHWAAIPFDRIGGFVFEPGSSSGLVRFPPEALVRSIEAVVRRNRGSLVVNEVTTGVGRTGKWFGYQHYGISPDIVALGKGIGNGYPVSVAAFSPGVMEALGGKPLSYAQSHQNDPLGAAVALEVVRVIREEGLIERGRGLAAALAAGLAGIKARTGRIGEIRTRGLMAAVELIDGSEADFTTRVHRELVHRGFVVGRRPRFNLLRLDPSLTIDPKDIERFLETLEDVLAGTSEATS